MPLYNPATAAPASQIATSGTPVSISSTSPTANQVLTASSGTAAAWATPAGGGTTLIVTTADLSFGSPGVADFTGLSWALGFATYEFYLEGRVSNGFGPPTVSLGVKYSSSMQYMTVNLWCSSNTDGSLNQVSTAYTTASSRQFSCSPVGASGTTTAFRLFGTITTNTPGNFTFQGGTNPTSSTVLLTGSFGRVRLA